VVQQPLASPTPLSPFNSGGDPSFGKTLMGQSALDDSYLKYHPQQQFPELQLGQYQSSIMDRANMTNSDPGLGKTQIGLGLSSLMGQQPLPARSERPAGTSDQDWQGYLSAAEDMRKYRKESGDMGRYIGVGEGGYDYWKNSEVSLAANKEKYGPGYSGLATDIGGVMTNVDKEGNALSPMSPPDILPSASPFLNTRPGDEGAPLMPPSIENFNPSDYPPLVGKPRNPNSPPRQFPRPVDDRDLRPFPRPVDDRDLRPFPRPVDDRDLRPPPTTPMPGDVGYVPYGSSNNQLPTPTPTPTPMPGDVGYVPYGSSNNQPLVQGLAGGGPVGTLSFVELLKQIMEN
jgi:hypothetical protein